MGGDQKEEVKWVRRVERDENVKNGKGKISVNTTFCKEGEPIVINFKATISVNIVRMFLNFNSFSLT